MKRTLLSLFIVAVLAAFIPGCSSGPRPQPDTVAIVDVQSTKLPDNEFTSVRVRVAYSLRSAERGVVMLGFDLEKPGQYIILGQQEIKQGLGEVELVADVRLPKRSTVTVHADLSEVDHPPEWASLANASREFTIAK